MTNAAKPATQATPEVESAPAPVTKKAPAKAAAAPAVGKASAKPAAKVEKKKATVADAAKPAKVKPASAKKAAPVAPKAVSKAAPKTAAKPASKAEPKPKKPKLVRDSFTIPKAEYAVLDELKLRATQLQRPVKKGELLRAGIKALAGMADAAFLSALEAVPTIKTGRPSKD